MQITGTVPNLWLERGEGYGQSVKFKPYYPIKSWPDFSTPLRGMIKIKYTPPKLTVHFYRHFCQCFFPSAPYLNCWWRLCIIINFFISVTHTNFGELWLHLYLSVCLNLPRDRQSITKVGKGLHWGIKQIQCSFILQFSADIPLKLGEAIPNYIFVSRKNAGRFSKDFRRKKNKNLSSAVLTIFLPGCLVGFSRASLREKKIYLGMA